ncbi:hypothetical protein [Caballeronia sp. DA-9]
MSKIAVTGGIAWWAALLGHLEPGPVPGLKAGVCTGAWAVRHAA